MKGAWKGVGQIGCVILGLLSFGSQKKVQGEFRETVASGVGKGLQNNASYRMYVCFSNTLDFPLGFVGLASYPGSRQYCIFCLCLHGQLSPLSDCLFWMFPSSSLPCHLSILYPLLTLRSQFNSCMYSNGTSKIHFRKLCWMCCV